MMVHHGGGHCLLRFLSTAWAYAIRPYDLGLWAVLKEIALS